MCLKTIPNFPNYVITKTGHIWSKFSNKYLRPCTNNGRKQLCLWKNGKHYNRLVHRLVLETFVGSCPKGMEACHNDGNPANNHLSNLRWGTKSDNTIDSIKQGMFANSKLTKDDVLSIRYMYSKEGYSQHKIAKIYNIGNTTVSYIVNHKTWKHI